MLQANVLIIGDDAKQIIIFAEILQENVLIIGDDAQQVIIFAEMLQANVLIIGDKYEANNYWGLEKC